MNERDPEHEVSGAYQNLHNSYRGVDDFAVPPLSGENQQPWSHAAEIQPLLPRAYHSGKKSKGHKQLGITSSSARQVPPPPRINASGFVDIGQHDEQFSTSERPGSSNVHVKGGLNRTRYHSNLKQMPLPPRINRSFDPGLIILPKALEPAPVRLSVPAQSSIERSGSLGRNMTQPWPSPPGLPRRSPSQSIDANFTQPPSPPYLRQRSSSAKDIHFEFYAHETPSLFFHGENEFSATGNPLAMPMPFRGNHTKETERPLSTPGSSPFASGNIRPDESRSESGHWVNNRFSSALSGSKLLKSRSSSVSGALGIKTYQYQPLNQAEFRLIKILQQTMSTIKCEIEHYSLDDPPEYVAVSYAWGDADDTEKILLEGANIPVTVSLCGALGALREKKKNVLVWVDALCIDQQNKEERTQQVLLMTSIYARATSVALWLGPECDDSDLAVKLLEELVSNAETPRYITSLLSSRKRSSEISAVVSLFERDYWKRLWVVQEVFNARDIIVYCGSSKLPWDVYTSASLLFRRHKGDLDHYFPASLGGDERHRVLQSHYTYSQILVYHGPSSLPDVGVLMSLKEESLLEVMRACREKLTADARDKLYGILGVLPEHIRTEFPVDYNLSVKEIYTNVADYLLNTSEHLDVICESIHFPVHTSSTNVPSWVPDWSNITTVTAMGRSFKFSASKESKAEYKLLGGRRKLEISAVFLDEISGHGISVGTLCTLADYLMAFLHWRALLLESIDRRRSDDRQRAFCKTLCLSQTISGWSEQKWLTACYHVFASLIRERLPRLPIDRKLYSFVGSNGTIEPGERRQFLQQHFGNRMFGRCFCMTRAGHMGMGSGFMAAGDIVVVPLGCSTPIILRPEGRRGEYYFVGDVYIHDYMEGRVLDEMRTGERELRKYVLH